jgi:hypothetical protein
LRQTDGERFFADRKHVEFAKESNTLSSAFATIKTQNRLRKLSDAIMYPLASELFAFAKRTFVEQSIAVKIRR